jgi:hypothetical protein
MSILARIRGLVVVDVPPSTISPSAVELRAAGNASKLDADEVRELRDALTEWLQRIGRDHA